MILQSFGVFLGPFCLIFGTFCEYIWANLGSFADSFPGALPTGKRPSLTIWVMLWMKKNQIISRKKKHIRHAFTLHGNAFTLMFTAVQIVPPFAPFTTILYVEFNDPVPQLFEHEVLVVTALQLMAVQ